MANCQTCSKSIRTKSEIGWFDLIWMLCFTAGIAYFFLGEAKLEFGFVVVWGILFICVLIYTSVAEFILSKLRKIIHKESVRCSKCRRKDICERCGISFSPFDAFGVLFHLTLLIVYLSVVLGVEVFLDDLQSLSSFFGISLNHAIWIITITWLSLLVRSIYPRRRCYYCGVSCERCNEEVDPVERMTIILVLASAVYFFTSELDPWYGCSVIFLEVVFVLYFLLGLNKICDDCFSEILEPSAEWLEQDSDAEEE